MSLVTPHSPQRSLAFLLELSLKIASTKFWEYLGLPPCTSSSCSHEQQSRFQSQWAAPHLSQPITWLQFTCWLVAALQVSPITSLCIQGLQCHRSGRESTSCVADTVAMCGNTGLGFSLRISLKFYLYKILQLAHFLFKLKHSLDRRARLLGV